MEQKIIHPLPIQELGSDFFDPVEAASFPAGILRFRNQKAAQFIDLDHFTEAQWKEHFWAFKPLPGNLPQPLALRYHGHQFTHYNPELGDGRGFLFAQFPKNNTWYDLGTKGSGTTPYSRAGDGRLTLKGAYREALATELLQSLGVNTSKTLSIFETGEQLIRYDEPSPTRAAVLVRLSHGHIRIGSFQRLAYFKDTANLQKLTEHCLQYYFPEILQKPGPPLTAEEKAFLFYQTVVHRCALLTAQWMLAGFVHGVLNTDNINITGESFDYGPYRFLPQYDLRFTAAYFDQQGLYAYGRQPVMMLWNLQRLGECLKLAYNTLPVEEILEEFSDEFNAQVKRLFLLRLNLKSQGDKKDTALLSAFFGFIEGRPLLFEQSYFDFFGGAASPRIQGSPQKTHYTGPDFENFMAKMKTFEVENPGKSLHPYFKNAKPCTLLIEEIEEIWKPIAENDDWTDFEKKIESIRSFRGLYE